MSLNNKKRSAFTLIELLVVIAIIGILSTLAVVALQSARSKARDTKRISDIRQMQTALELYFNDNGAYPVSIANTIASSGIVYMATTPSSPTPADGDCSESDNNYYYTSDGSTYSISTCVGSNVSSLDKGIIIASQNGIIHYTPPLPNACNDLISIKDSRDNVSYPIVAIGTQCWTAKNMDYWTEDGYWYYQNNYGWYERYGKFYTWEKALSVCPNGWHLPSAYEWQVLNSALSADSKYWCGGDSNKTSKTLASQNQWANFGMFDECKPYSNVNANNSSGFGAYPMGYVVPNPENFSGMGGESWFWTSTESYWNYAKSFVISTLEYNSNGDYIGNIYKPKENLLDKFNGANVRCIKN